MTRWRLTLGLTFAALLASVADVPAQAPPPAGASVRLDGERISVRVNQVLLRTVLEAIAAEARLELDVRGEGDRLVTASLDRLRLEAALHRILGGNFVLARGRLVVFLPGSGRGQHPDRPALPSEIDHVAAASAAPTIRPLGPASEPSPPAAAGDLRVRRRPTKPGGIVIVRPPTAARSSHVLDDQEARQLAGEIDARVADRPRVEVTDLLAIQSSVQRTLP